jgi:hypothetical protein
MQIVADTGPLYDFLVLHFRGTVAAFKDVKTPKDLWHVGGDQKRQLVLTSYFKDEIEALWTTPGVVAEIWRLSWRDMGRGSNALSAFWTSATLWFRDKPVTEESVPLLELPEDMLGRLGPVDAGLIELAKRLAKRPAHSHQLQMLTGDSGLRDECEKQGVPCRHVDDLWA